MTWIQKEITLSARNNGFYLITDEIVGKIPELRSVKIGLLHLFIKHTSAGLTLNENYDPDVRTDMKNAFARLVPEGDQYIHADEGPDDMPAHIKASLVGQDVTIPIRDGRLQTGTWQGIYLCEFREYRHRRTIVATINGDMDK